MPQLSQPKPGRDRNLALWLLIPIWLVAAAGSVYATVQFDPESMTVAEIGWVILQGAMIVTGVIILANRPRNLVGRLIRVPASPLRRAGSCSSPAYHSQELVDRFTTDLREQTHVDQLTAGLSSVVQETLHPSALGMWLSDRR